MIEHALLSILLAGATDFRGVTYQGHTEMIEEIWRYMRGEECRTSYVWCDEPIWDETLDELRARGYVRFM